MLIPHSQKLLLIEKKKSKSRSRRPKAMIESDEDDAADFTPLEAAAAVPGTSSEQMDYDESNADVTYSQDVSYNTNTNVIHPNNIGMN